MSISAKKDGEIWVVRLTGMIRKAEMDTIQNEAIKELPAEKKVRILVIAEDFLGWQRGDPWGDVSFIANYGDRMEKMAIVAEPKWQDQLLMFTGAGLRSTKIEFFPSDRLAEARTWLAE
jgi:hypothetical protein